MNKKEIISGLQDLIIDRESFINDNDKENIFAKDKQILEEAVKMIENSIDKSVVEKYLVEEQEKFNVYKRESKENENLKLGMWKHLGAKNMCEKILGIERNIVTLD